MNLIPQHRGNFLERPRAAMTQFLLGFIFTALSVASTYVVAAPLPTKMSFQPILDRYDVAIGSVESIVQDNQGYIWIGGDNGLLRYDGYELRLMKQLDNSGAQIKGVSDMLVDKRGYLWISTLNGLVRYAAEEERFVRYNKLAHSPIKQSAIYSRNLAELPSGELVLATSSGLAVIDVVNETTQILKHEANNPKSLQSNSLSAVAVDKNGNVWVGGDRGVDRIRWSTGEITHYGINSEADLKLTEDQITNIATDGRGDVWIGTTKGLNRYSFATNTITQFHHDPSNLQSLSSDVVSAIFEDSKGILWIGTDKGGLNYFNPKLNQFFSFESIPGSMDSLNSNGVRSIFEDKNGDLWIGNYPTGVNYFNRANASNLVYVNNPSDRKSLNHNSVTSFAEDLSGNFWLGTDGGGLDYFDRKSETFTHYIHDSKNANSISSNSVMTTYIDAEGTLWVGTLGGGLNRLNKPSWEFSRYDKTATSVPGVSQSKSLYSLNVSQIMEDSLGNLWIGTHGAALAKLDRKSGVFSHYLPDLEDADAILFNNVYSMFEDSRGRFWVGTENSLELMDRESGTFTHFQSIEGDATSLSNGKTFSIFEDSKARVWIGTSEGLNLLLPDGKTFRRYDINDGFNNHSIFSIIEGNDGQLWMGTDNGISSFDPETGKANNFHTNSGWLKGIFNPNAIARSSLKELLFGANNGFSIVNINELKTNSLAPAVTITDFKLQSQSLRIGDQQGLLTKAIDHTTAITLNRDQNVFSFSFAALNFRDPDKNEYAYRLLGFDKNWHEVGTQRSATYTNINPGEYIFQVKASNNDGLWNDEGKSIKVRILSPWWQSNFAYLIYALLIIGIVVLAIALPRHKRKLMEEQIKKLSAFNQLKDEFIAHAYQELDAPLNGVVDNAESVLKDFGATLSPALREKLTMILASGNRLAGLLNNSPELSKLIGVASAADNPNAAIDNSSKSLDEKPIVNDAKSSAIEAKPKANDTSSVSTPKILPPSNRSNTHIQNRILIVDDNPINQQVLINQLTLHKYNYAVAGDGFEALRLIDEEGPFDLILLDVMMPRMSGYEVCTKLREKYAMEELSIIFLTAKNSPDDLESGFKVGANDFLTKPFSMGELNSRIRTQLQLINNNRNLEFLVDIRTQEVAVAHNELKTLDEIVGIINQEIRIDSLLSVILKQTTALFPDTSYVAYWKWDERTERFSLWFTDSHDHQSASSEAIARHELEIIFLNDDHQIAEDVYLQGRLLLSEEDEILIGLPETSSHLSMAFRQHGIITGILILGSRHSDSAFHTMLSSNYERLRNHIDSALSKAKLVEKLEQQCDELEQMSFTDPLTGLKNRRFLTKYIEHDISLLQRKHFKRLSQLEDLNLPNEDDFIFFIMDIDHFKHTNDSLGHAAGDRVLADIKQILEPIFRTSDYRIRWGGEEFLIVARFCDREHASMKAEQLRAAMEDFHFVIEEGKVVRKTCSIGYACYPFSTTEPKAFSWTQVISLADLALYAVKKSQRNGWLGVTNTSPVIDDERFKLIMENPDLAIEEGHISVTTNVAPIKWS